MLSKKQKMFVSLYLQYNSISQACKEANIHRNTYYSWLKNDDFRKELEKEINVFNSSAIFTAKKNAELAIDKLVGLINQENLEAIKVYLTFMQNLETIEIKQQIKNLNDIVNKLIN